MSPKELSGRVAPLTVACGVAFLQFVGAYMRIPLVPLYAKTHGATAADVGMIVGLFMLTAACMAIPVGYLSDRVGRRVVIAAGVGIGVLVSAALPSTEHLGALMALYAAAGVGVAAFTPAMMAYIADAAPPAMMGRAYGWYTTAQYAGIAVGPALGGADRGSGGHPTSLSHPESGPVVTLRAEARAVSQGTLLTNRNNSKSLSSFLPTLRPRPQAPRRIEAGGASRSFRPTSSHVKALHLVC